MSEEERNKMRKELKERFSPGARPMPTTLQGLTSLANERIEDAIARGKFKNIPRGKGKNIERDYNASSPFLDTTEYFMNKIIQKQEIVPPWIEKQQELVKGVASFRGRLRNDWKRHAARTIASKGGSLESQIRRAKAYALAEEKVNPAQTRVENLSKIDSQGNLSTVSVQETAPKPLTAQLAQDEQARSEPPTITVTEQPLKPTTADTSSAPSSPSPSPSSHPLSPSEPSPNTPQPAPILPMSDPFRDPSWEATEKSYHTLAINTLNSLTRSYNLMAPKLAQKPYLSLARELNRCYAEVAPLLPEEIRQRARTPVSVMAESGGGVGKEAKGGVLDRWGGHETRAIRDEDLSRKGYGFKEFWRDIFAKKS